MPRSFRSSLVALCLLPAAAVAQAPDAAALVQRSRDALAPVAALVGQWEGEATIRRGPGEPTRVRQSEDILWGASGTVISIRGTGRDPATGATVFEAVGTLWFDPDLGKVRLRTHTDGRSVEADVEVRPDTLVWGFAVPGGRVRYVIALTADTWTETGDYIAEGRPPLRTTELRLRRVRR